MATDIDTLATALYVKIDDLLQGFPQIAPPRPARRATNRYRWDGRPTTRRLN